jgi:hypothetical protein
MNRDDLLVRINVTLNGWLHTRARSVRPLTRTTHERLLRAVRSASRPDTARVGRGSLLREVNQCVGALIDLAIVDLEFLRHSGCTYSFEDYDDDGNDIETLWDFDRVPWPGSALKVLKMASSLRLLPEGQQDLVAQIYLAEDELGLSENYREMARDDGRRTEESQGALWVAKDQARVNELRSQLGKTATIWLSDHPNVFPLGWWPDYPIPVCASRSVANSDLARLSGWYRELGLRLFQPMALDANAPAQARALWESAWQRLEDCGDAFVLLSGWLRCLALTEDSRRCDVCYRHVGRSDGLRKYCADHARKATEDSDHGQRQDPRELHVSRIYRRVLRRFLRDTPDLDKLLSHEGWGKSETKAMLAYALEEGVPASLASMAASLAAFLRALWPVLSAPLADMVQLHFSQLVGEAWKPFRLSTNNGDPISDIKVRRDQRSAESWLEWETFFRTWFGLNTEHDVWIDGKVYKGLDVDHPIVVDQSAGVSKVAHDLVRFRCWHEVDSHFDYAYSNAAEIVRIRRESAKAHLKGRPLSFRKIGRMFNMSGEAARKAYLWAIDQNAPDRRTRVIQGRLRDLESRLA